MTLLESLNHSLRNSDDNLTHVSNNGEERNKLRTHLSHKSQEAIKGGWTTAKPGN